LASRERTRPLILVTNDDGYDAPGLEALIRAVEPLGDLLVVSPERGISGASHALTLDRPLRVRERGVRRFSVDGTPADCVHLGVLNLAGGAGPDLVVSGVNRGLNVGDDVTYSGTVAAAMEGALLGIPSVAFSMEIGEDGEPPFEQAEPFVRSIGGEVLRRGLDARIFLGVNFPAGAIRGIRITRQGTETFRGAATRRTDPAGRPYYWIAEACRREREEANGDRQAVQEGFISVTPLCADLTDHVFIDKLSAWPFDAVGDKT
jgi:5'-nucleotidase